MKILIFSWRDIKHPGSGGAEICTIEHAQRWVKKGHQVTLISARFPGSKKQELINGVKVIRWGKFFRYHPGEYLIYLFKNYALYKEKLAGKFDLVIDQVHGLPFFTPLYVKEKIVLFPHEVAGKIWFYEIPFPFSLLGFLLEKFYIQLFRNFPFYTVSSSTANDLKKLGAHDVYTFFSGLNFKPLKKVPPKSPTPLLVSLGRLTKMKRVEDVLRAFRLLHKDFPDLKLLVIGKGKPDYLEKLKQLTIKMTIDDRVTFTGYIPEKEKIKLLGESWLMVNSSLKEGWALTVIEAAACGTPTVAYKIPGLADSIQEGKSGLFCRKNIPEELTRNIRRLLLDHKLRKKLSETALSYSRNFSWDKSAKDALKILEKIYLKSRSLNPPK